MSNSDEHAKKRQTQRSRVLSSLDTQKRMSRFKSQHSSRNVVLDPLHCQTNTWNFLETRRQNQLNTLFNIRKRKLGQITKANYMIHQKLNKQQTHYPSLKYQTIDKDHSVYGQSRCSTLQQIKRNEQNKKILGPIVNFKALTIDTSLERDNCRNSIQNCENNASASLIKFCKTRFKAISTNKDDFPMIFQFY